jgi:hypothetical protein
MMELETAIKKQLLSIKLEDTIPSEYHWMLRKYFQQMYVVGFEAGREDFAQQLNHHSRKIIAQYNLNGKLVNTFNSLKEACKRTGFSKSGIQYSITNNIPTRQKWVWKYIEKEKEPVHKERTLP